MSWANSLLSTAILFLCLQSQAATTMYMMGGAGNAPDAEENEFQPDFQSFGAYAVNHEWNTQALYNGDHPQDITDLQNKTKIAVRPFSQSNFTAYLNSLSQQAKTGKLTSQDKVLIVIDAHGYPVVTQNGHQVSCNDGPCNPTGLKSLIQTLESKNIPAAILDFSCFSGNTQKLASSKTCVISATRKDDVGYSTFSANFSAAMKHGKSLEQVFLEARKNPTSYGYPQISSPAGNATENILSNLADHAKFCTGSWTCSAVKKNSCLTHKNAAKTLLQTVNDAQGATLAQSYVNASLDYQSEYDKYKAISRIYAHYASRMVIGDNGFRISWGELSNYVAISDLNNLALKFPEIYRQYYDLQKSNPEYKKMLELKRQISDVADYGSEYTDGGVVLKSPLKKLARKAQQAEQSLYDKVYRAESARLKAPNPCATFTL